MIKLSKLVGIAQEGVVSGICVFCGEETSRGHPMRLKEKFTMYSALYHGDCICEFCYYMYNNQAFRNRSWIATQGQVRFVKREDIKSMLLSPPRPPFAIYVTKGGQKQGWINIMNRVSFSDKKFYVGNDFVDSAILFDVALGSYMFQVAETLIAAGVTKSQLLSRHPVMQIDKLYRLYSEHEGLFAEYERFVGRPDWELVIFAL